MGINKGDKTDQYASGMAGPSPLLEWQPRAQTAMCALLTWLLIKQVYTSKKEDQRNVMPGARCLTEGPGLLDGISESRSTAPVDYDIGPSVSLGEAQI